MTPQLDVDSLYLIHLMSCALRGEAPQPLPAGASWDVVYGLALSNSVITACAFAVAEAPGIDAAEAKRWRDEVYKNALRHEVFADEREAIFAAMGAVGLACMPVKGVVTAREYPHPEMRWMCDNDFLFGRLLPDGSVRAADHDDSLALRRIMEGRGYWAKWFEVSKEDAYEKAPFLNMEAHRALMDLDLDWSDYFANPWPKARRALVGAENTWELTCEDAYIHHVAHMFKHFSHAGHGVRGIADEWVLLHFRGGFADRSYIDTELSKLGMLAFEKDIVELAKAIIDKDACGNMLCGAEGALTSDQIQMLAYMLGSGTYGSGLNRTRNKIREESAEYGVARARFRYIWRRLFPSFKSLKVRYPILERAPWLLPVLHLYRFTVRPFKSRAILRAEIPAIMGKSGEESPVGTDRRDE